MSQRRRKVIWQILRYIGSSLVLIFFLFPILWIGITAFKSAEEFMHTPPIWFPAQPAWSSFSHAIKVGGLKSLKNSLVISSAATILSLFIGSMAAYGLAR